LLDKETEDFEVNWKLKDILGDLELGWAEAQRLTQVRDATLKA